ncbi:MAG: cation-transporting P-type ATPase [Clostridiales bacterium]|nr:cation-transporting P-type ATPase [Clostridiales bacterium]
MSKWYHAAIDEVLSMLKSNQYAGLKKKDAKKRLTRDGKNNIYPVPKGYFREYLLHMLTDFTSVLLLVAAVLCIVFEQNRSAVVIAVTILIGYSFCALVYLRAQKVLENMGGFALPVAKVMRDARLYLIRCEQLVKGDIVFLSAGDVVPADVRLLESDALVIDETLLFNSAVVHKDARFTSDHGVDVSEQKNMAFASTIVLSGSAKGIVTEVGAETVVCRMKKNKPIVSHDKLRVLEKLRRVCSMWSLVMLALVFVLTALSLFLGRGSLFASMLSLLSLAVASMAELYMAFGYIVVASGIFSALRQYKDVNAGALIKNSAKLDEIRRLSCIIAPKDGCFVVDELAVEQVYYDDILYGVKDKGFLKTCGKILEYAVISTGIYGAKNLVSMNSISSHAYTTEEEAIISLAQEYALYNYNLDKEFPLLEHRSADTVNPFDTSLVSRAGENFVVVRGDAIELIYKCTHRRRAKGEEVLSAHETNELLLAANRMAIGGYRVCGIATKGTSVMNLKLLSKAQQRLTFEGFIVFRETLLPEAAKNIKLCEEAGIKVVMFADTVCEHNRYTARALGVMKNDEEIMTGKLLDQMDEGVFVANARKYSLYEGLSVKQKRKVVNLLQLAGENAACLGGRVEESSLLGEANVGYCQSLTLSARADRGGIDTLNRDIPILHKSTGGGAGRGCDALKLKADVIVSMADHAGRGGFNAIVKSIRVAKSVYDNLHHMLGYLVSSQIARLILVVFSVFADISIFSPAQIIVSGLIVDFAAVLVFAFDQPRKNALTDSEKRQPRPLALKNGLGKSLGAAVLWAVMITISVLLAVYIAIDTGTVAFFGFLLTQLVMVSEYRSEKSIFRSGKGFNNVYAFFLTFVLSFIALISFRPEIAALMDIVTPSVPALILCMIVPICMLIGCEFYKLYRHKHKKSTGLLAKTENEQEDKISDDDLVTVNVESQKKTRIVEKKSFFKKKKCKDKTESYIEERFSEQAVLQMQEEPVEENPLSALDEATVRELVFLSVKCGITDMDIAAWGADAPKYDELAETIADTIRPDSSVEVIATVVIASLSANHISDISFDTCMQCAEQIKENMIL